MLEDSYFVGTAVAPDFDASISVVQNNFHYIEAPLNFLQVYDEDLLYSEGLGNCKMRYITGSPAAKGGPLVPDLAS